MKFKRSLLRQILLFLGLTFGVILTAYSIDLSRDPVVVVKNLSNELLVSLKRDRPKTRGNDEWIYRLVKRIVLPQVDLDGMSRAVLGRNMWLQATAPQRTAFIDEFTHVVVKTYSAALSAYTNETIKFFPLRENYTQEDRVLVRSQVIRNDGPPIPLDYRLIWMDKEWDIYDLSVEGVSLLQSFRSQFESEFSQGTTLDQLIRNLHQRNQGVTS